MDNTDKLEKYKSWFYLIASIIGATALVIAAGYLLGQISLAVETLFVAVIFVFFLHGPVDWLEKKKIPRGLGALISFLVLVGILVLLGAIIGPVFGDQIVAFVAALPGYVDEFISWAQDLWTQYGHLFDNEMVKSWMENLGSTLSSWVSSLASASASGIISVGTSIGNTLLVFFMALVASFWFLLDYHRIKRELIVVIGPKRIENVSAVMDICGRCVGGYCKGVLVASVCTGLISGIGFSIIGLPYPAVLGLLTAIMNIVPVIGPWIAGMLAALLGISVSPFACIMSIVITVCAQQFTDTFITPRVMSSTVELHPALVIIALTAGGSVGGIFGMILAVPLTAAAKAIYVYYFEKRTGRKLTFEDGAFFKGKNASGEVSTARSAPSSEESDGAVQSEVVLSKHLSGRFKGKARKMGRRKKKAPGHLDATSEVDKPGFSDDEDKR